MKSKILTLCLLLITYNICFSQNEPTSEYVILLHGLARSSKSMNKMAKHLKHVGYKVYNLNYPSTQKKIEEIAIEDLQNAIDSCLKMGAQKINFVTHSMGGIIVRYYLINHHLEKLGKVVMLSPPNHGSEVVDKLKDTYIYKKIHGPAGQQLGTDQLSMPNKLGSINFELGIITGDRTINLFLSLLIPGKDDGKVSIKNAKIKGMKDFLIIHSSHPFIMKNNETIKQTIYFLKNGTFNKKRK